VISDGRRNDEIYADPSWCNQLMAQAARIAINRTVAGLHFPVDSAAGAVLGLTLGKYFVSRCKEGDSYLPWTFDGSRYPPDRDFYREDYFDPKTGNQTVGQYVTSAVKQHDPVAASHSAILEWMWNKAKDEWQ
jgi:hypothetical protein